MKFLFKFIFVIAIAAGAVYFLKPDAFTALKARLTAGPGTSPVSTTRPTGEVMPKAVREAIATRGLSSAQAWAEFDQMLATAPRYHLRGRFSERLASGHILVYGGIGAVGSASENLSTPQTVAVFGFPGAAGLEDHAAIDCEVRAAGTHQFTDGRGERLPLPEFIYQDLFDPNKPTGWASPTPRPLGESRLNRK
jgi:hypothetical protein